MSEQISGQWRNIQSGAIYTVIGIGKTKYDLVWVRSVFYRDNLNDHLFARPVSEWAARFERVEV